MKCQLQLILGKREEILSLPVTSVRKQHVLVLRPGTPKVITRKIEKEQLKKLPSICGTEIHTVQAFNGCSEEKEKCLSSMSYN